PPAGPAGNHRRCSRCRRWYSPANYETSARQPATPTAIEPQRFGPPPVLWWHPGNWPWDAALTQLDVLHSPILDAVTGWLIVIQDPDGTASGPTHGSPTVPRSSRPPTAHGWQAEATGSALVARRPDSTVVTRGPRAVAAGF